MCKSFCGYVFSFLLCKYLEVKWMDCMVGVYVTFQEIAKLFPH